MAGLIDTRTAFDRRDEVIPTQLLTATKHVHDALKGVPEGPFKLTTILVEESKKLNALDRYERRALPRRKFAIRTLDEAQRS